MGGVDTEVNEEAWLELRPGWGRQFLEHSGTGEMRTLFDPHTLHFHGGNGVLTPSGGTGVWAASFLEESSLHEQVQPDGTTKLAVVPQDPEKPERLRSDIYNVENRVRLMKLPGLDTTLEVCVSDLARTGSTCVRWCVPRLLHELLGPSFAGDWFCRHDNMFRKALDDNGILRTECRDSRKSYIDSCRCKRVPVDATLVHDLEREYTFSTRALVVSVLHVASEGKIKIPDGVNVKDNVRRVINALARQFLPQDTVGSFRHEGVVLQARFSGDIVTVLLDGLSTQQRVALASLAPGLAAPMGEWLLALFRALRRGSRLSPSKKGFYRALFQWMLQCLHSHAESTRNDVRLWEAEPWVDLRPLERTPVACKTRRLGSTFKLEVSKAVAQTTGIRTVGQFFASAGLLRTRRRAQATHVAKKKKRARDKDHNRRIPEEVCRQNAAAARREFATSKHCWFSADGVRAGNKELLVTAVGCPQKKTHTWAAPVVTQLSSFSCSCPGPPPSDQSLLVIVGVLLSAVRTSHTWRPYSRG